MLTACSCRLLSDLLLPATDNVVHADIYGKGSNEAVQAFQQTTAMQAALPLPVVMT